MDGSEQTKTGGAIVSVILPTYDRAALLPRSIGSVLAQTMGDFELLIVDDGSTDDTAAVVDGFDDPRIRYLRLERNRGLSAARNAGLDAARGRFLAFQDSDDEWRPEKLERQLQLLADRPDVVVTYGDMIRRYADGRQDYLRSPEVLPERLIDPDTDFWQTYMLAMQPAMIRRSAMGDLRFDEELRLYEDLDFHLRLAFDHRYQHIREPLVIYHESEGLTADPAREFRARRQLLAKYGPALRREAPAFMLREWGRILTRRSLLPLVARHMEPMEAAS